MAENMFKRTLLTGAVLSLGFVAAAQAEFKVMTVNGEKVWGFRGNCW